MFGEIGAGGMATVHLGRGPDGEVVAIKRLKPYLAEEPGVVQWFLDEARLSARVRHPNVVATLDVVTHEGEVFLVMEYIEGVSLAFLLRTRSGTAVSPSPPPALKPDLTASIVSGALRGLHAAHEATGEMGEPLNIVHRDVSPQNILVGVDGTARVLDFGVAKALGRQQTTRDGAIKGKLGYMAPEQLSGRGVTRRTDVFAAGIVLWELLTGERLFARDDDAVTVTRVLMERVRPPSDVRPDAPRSLDAVVLRALERDPTKRYLSAHEMADALDAAMKPASSAAVGWWVRSIAADELARRAVLLRASSGQMPVKALAPDTSPDAMDSATATVPIFEATPVVPRRRRRGALVAVVAALALTIAGWGGIQASRARTTRGEGAGGPTSSASTKEAVVMEPSAAVSSTSTPAPIADEKTETALTLPSTESPVHRAAPPRHPSPKAPPARPASSTRERLYSRD
jgi:serine/threonine-protein kinase